MNKALLYELGQSISFGRLSLKAKVLWPMLLAASDEQGRGIAEPDVVKWHVCPNVGEIAIDDVVELLGEMQEQGMIHLYQDGRGRGLYQVVRWWEFQQLAWAQPSRFDAPDNWVDRVRCRVKGQGDPYKENWDEPGGFYDGETPEPTKQDEPDTLNDTDIRSANVAPTLAQGSGQHNITQSNLNESNLNESNEDTFADKSAKASAGARDGSSSNGLTEGQRFWLSAFGAKRFANTVQREAVLALERDFGTDALVQGVEWAAKQGMAMGRAVTALETALPKWGKAKNDNVIRV